MIDFRAGRDPIEIQPLDTLGMPKTTTTPERTLAAFTLVSRPRWLWLAILLLATLSLLTYGLLGAIPRTVNGIGVTRDGNRLIPVASSESGIVEEMLVEVGQAVAAGEAVGKLVSAVLAVEIDSAERRLGLLRSEDERASAAESATMRDAERRLDSTTREASDEIRSSEELLALRERLLGEQEKLLAEGFVAEETVLQTRTTVAGLRSGIESARTRIIAAELELERSTASMKQAQAARNEAILAAEATVDRLREQQESDRTVRSIVAGTVVEISRSVGDPVQPGERLTWLKPAGAEGDTVSVVAFLPQRTAKELDVGDAVQVQPTFVDRSRYGYIKGRLISIGTYGATDDQLGFYLQNTAMINEVVDRYKSVLIAEIELERDERTESGFEWSTHDGWPGEIGPGSILDVQVIFRVDRPIELLLPWIRSLLGQ